MSICEATTLDRISRPSATTAAAVSSHEDSIPNILKFTLCFLKIPFLPYASTRSPLRCSELPCKPFVQTKRNHREPTHSFARRTFAILRSAFRKQSYCAVPAQNEQRCP